MPSPTVILGILLVIALSALAASGAMLKSAWQDVAEAEAKYAQQQAETQKAIKQITDMKIEHQKGQVSHSVDYSHPTVMSNKSVPVLKGQSYEISFNAQVIPNDWYN